MIKLTTNMNKELHQRIKTDANKSGRTFTAELESIIKSHYANKDELKEFTDLKPPVWYKTTAVDSLNHDLKEFAIALQNDSLNKDQRLHLESKIRFTKDLINTLQEIK